MPTLTPQELTHDVLDVSVTERGQFRTCRRRWKLQTLDNLEPRVPSPALPIGTGVHKALEVFYRPKGGSLKATIAEFLKWSREEAAKWEEQGAPDEALDELHVEVGVCVQVLENYETFDKASKVQLGKVLAIEGALTTAGKKLVKPKPPEGYPPVEIHKESGRVLVPIVNPGTKEPLPHNPCLSARIDLLTERTTPKKGLWVVDHKTASSPSGEEGIDFDDQITGYCYVVWRWTGKLPRGVVLNTLVKKAPKEPRWVSEGKKLSTAKDQLTTADQYREAIKEAGLMGAGGTILSDPHAECLESLLARGWDPFFRRYEAVRNEFEIKNFEYFLFEEFQDMAKGRRVAADSRFFYPNSQTVPFGICQSCSVRRICRAMSDGSDWEGIAETEFQEGEDRKAT